MVFAIKINKYILELKWRFKLRIRKHDEYQSSVNGSSYMKFPIYTNDGYVIQRYLDKDGEEMEFKQF